MVDGYEKRVMDKRLILVLRIVLLHLSQELIWLTGILSRDWELPRWQWSHSPTWRAVSSCSRSGLQLIWLLPPSFKSRPLGEVSCYFTEAAFLDLLRPKEGFWLARPSFLIAPDNLLQSLTHQLGIWPLLPMHTCASAIKCTQEPSRAFSEFC